MTTLHWALICMACILCSRESAYSIDLVENQADIEELEDVIISKGDIKWWDPEKCCIAGSNSIRISQLVDSNITLLSTSDARRYASAPQ